MTSGSSDYADQVRIVANDTVADTATTQLVRSIVASAARLGLVWSLRPATVATPGAGGETRVVVDGTTVPIRAISMVGTFSAGTRVMVILSPPSGVHIVGIMDSTLGGLRSLVGGTQWVAAGAPFVAGVAGVEVLTGMATAPLALAAGNRHVVKTRVLYIAAGVATATRFTFRVRVGGLAGTQLSAHTVVTSSTAVSEQAEFETAFVPTSSVPTAYVLTCQRAAGAATLTVNRGGPTNPSFMVAHRDNVPTLTWA